MILNTVFIILCDVSGIASVEIRSGFVYHVTSCFSLAKVFDENQTSDLI